jgi:NAD(P)-dependent dehydrogenase (short-subunit alcohol dehydrogenase family)
MPPVYKLDQSVVVITGASSGLGRAAALAFAKHRCRLVLAARRKQLIEEVADACRAAGAMAIAVRTDVTIESDVDVLVRRTIETFGRIDVWVNNAGVAMFGFLHQGRFADHQRVIDTNLFGAMHAARAVVPIFVDQRRGTMINVGSILGKVGQAFVPSYVISKFALRGMTEAVRVQVAEYPDIHICSFLPYAIDTPHFESGKNVTGRAARAMQPIQPPEYVAAALVRMAQRPKREWHIPRYAPLWFFLHWLLPRPTERLMLHALQRFHLDGPEPPREGGLFEPVREPGSVHGHRQPIVSRARFTAWAVRDFLSTVISTTTTRS